MENESPHHGEVELEWVVSREGHEESTGEVGGERVPVVVKEEAVVAKGGHQLHCCLTYLCLWLHAFIN